MIGGLALLAVKLINDFFPSVGSYIGLSGGMGLIGGSSYYVPQVPLGNNMGQFVLPSAVAGAIPPPAAVAAGARLGSMRRTGRLM